MKTTHYSLLFSSLLLGAFLLCSCQRTPVRITSVETDLIHIDSTLDAIQDTAYLNYLIPIRENLDRHLNIPLGTSVEVMERGRINSRLLNWACDALAACARRYYDGEVDMAVVNAGGLRCDWPAGDITFYHVFELMPFDNELVILTLTGRDLYELAENCVVQGGQGVSEEFHVVGLNGQVESVLLDGQPIEAERLYHVATSDYLSGGADGLSALTKFSERVMTGKKIRDLYIEYIAEHPTIKADIDDRMIIQDDRTIMQ